MRIAGKSSSKSEATSIAIIRRSQAVSSPSFNDLCPSLNASPSPSTPILLAYPTLDLYLLLGLCLYLPLTLGRTYEQYLSVSIMESIWFLDMAATPENHKRDLLIGLRSTG